MNYCLNFSIRVEDELLRLIAEFEGQHPEEEVTVAKENELYSLAMETIIASDEGRTWAAGNVRLGEFILLIDCDTKVVSLSIPRLTLERGLILLLASQVPSIRRLGNDRKPGCRDHPTREWRYAGRAQLV